MIGLSRAHIAELVRELTPLVCGLRLREAQAQPPRDVLFVLEPPGGGPIRRLRVSAAPEGARLHLQIGSVKRHSGALGPFFRRLQEELDGSTLRELAQVSGDRIVRLEWKLPGGGSRTLVAELFGRHANLCLLDPAGRVLSTLAEPAADTPAAARVRVGALWEPPRSGPGARRSEPAEPTSLTDDFPSPPDPPERARETVRIAPLSWRVESSLGVDAEGRFDARQRKDLGDRLRRRLRSLRNRLAGLRTQAEGADAAEQIRMDAELLTAHLGSLKRGMDSIELADAHDDAAPPRRIALDPGLSPRRNVERLFARAKKLARVREKLPEEIALCERQLAGLEDLISRAADPEHDREATEREAVEGGWLPARQKPPKEKRPEKRLPYHRFFGCRGSEIRVGRSARDNDALTFRHARGNDVWLHTSDAPGSHVVLVTQRGKEPDPEELLDAAHLAIHFSPLRDSKRTGVHIAPQKGVKKPRRAPAGLVSVSGGKIRVIRVEADRLERLLASRGSRRPGESPGPPDDSGSQPERSR